VEEQKEYSPVREDATDMAEATAAAFKILQANFVTAEPEALLATAERLALAAYAAAQEWANRDIVEEVIEDAVENALDERFGPMQAAEQIADELESETTA
jgi:hypothetical protein